MSNPNKAPQAVPLPTNSFWLAEIQDFVKTIVVSPIGAPPFTPKKLDQQIRIVVNSLTAPTSKRLYWYSFEVGAWYYITLT